MSGQSDSEFSKPAVIVLVVALTLVVTVTVVLPVPWPWMMLIVPVATVALTVILSLFSPQIGRLAEFLARVPGPGSQLTATIGLVASVTLTVIRAGADVDDPNACRVVTEHLDGTFHVEEVLIQDADVVSAMNNWVPRVAVPIRSVRAMRGAQEVARWTPNLWQRLKWTWTRRW